jgi:hypothetical protein
VQNAPEYWWLAMLLIHITKISPELESESAEMTAKFEDDEMDYLRSLLQHFCSGMVPGSLEHIS